jgi:signal transduction histidine kinase
MALGTNIDLDLLLRLILERTNEALESERTILYLMTELQQGEPVHVERVTSWSGMESLSIPGKEPSITLDVLNSGEPVSARDVRHDPRFSRTWDSCGIEARTLLAVPVRSRFGRTIGALVVINKQTDIVSPWPPSPMPTPVHFDDDDQALLQALAALMSLTIEQTRLLVSLLDKNREVVEKNRELSITQAALKKKVGDLHVLYAIERATARATNRDELIAAVLPEVAHAVSSQFACIVLREEGLELLVHVVDQEGVGAEDFFAPPERGTRPSMVPMGPSIEPLLRKMRLPSAQLFASASVTHAETIVVKDLASALKGSDLLRELLLVDDDWVAGTAASVPLLDEHDESFGALVVGRKGDSLTPAQAFTDDDIEFLRLIALNISTGFLLEIAREDRNRQERLSTIGTALSGVMHDLKTPISVIDGYVQLMAKAQDSEQREELATKIQRQFAHITAMQTEVLAFARGDSSALTRRVYLSPFFADIDAQLRHEIARRRSPVQLAIDLRDRGTAKFDEAKVTRAIHNLARNAIEAMGDVGGTLSIHVTRPVGSLMIRVEDNGPGLPPPVQERLFQSFVTYGKKSGTGLGLAIVKKVIDDHNGTIDVQSSHSGTVFTLTIPQDEGSGLIRLPVTESRPPV